MKKLLKTLLTLSLILVTIEARATDLMQVFQQALVSDPTFQQTISQRLSDKEGMPINIAALLPNASLQVTPSVNKTTSSGPAGTLIATGTNRGYIMNLAVTQTIFDFGKFALVAEAHAISKQADATLNAALQDLMLRTSKAYFAILEDEDNIRYIESTRTAYAKQLDQVTQQYKVGLKTITDVYTANASYVESVADYIGAENQLADDKENLRVITGTFYPDLAKLNEAFPLITPHPAEIEAWVRTAEAQNWQIKAALYAADASRQIIKQQFAGHLPTLNVQGTYNVNFNRNISGPEAFLIPGSSQVHTRTLALNLNVPIFSGGLVVAETQQAQYNYQVACQKLELQIRTTMNQTRQSYLGIMSGISKINADKQAIKSNISSYDGMQAGYQVGTEILVNVLNQQQKVFQSQKEYAHDRYLYVINLLTLKQATGTLCQRDLVAINAWLEEGSDRRQSYAAQRAENDLKRVDHFAHPETKPGRLS